MKIAILLALATSVLLILPLVSAQDANETEELAGNAGIMPDSRLWGIDVALDKLMLALTSGPEKAKLGLQIAEERLLEVQAMSKKNNSAAAEKAEAEHRKTLEKVSKAIENLNETAISNETLNGIELGMQNHLAALAKVKARIQNNTNIPEETRAKLVTNFEELKSKAEELVVKIENKTKQIEQKQERARENTSEEESELEEESENEVTRAERAEGRGREQAS